MRERHFARLAVIDTATTQVAAYRRADDHRAGELALRPPPHVRQFIANLHHRRPDVVEKLYLDDRLEPAQRHSDGSTDNPRLGDRRIPHAVTPVHALESHGRLEDAALSL